MRRTTYNYDHFTETPSVNALLDQRSITAGWTGGVARAQPSPPASVPISRPRKTPTASTVNTQKTAHFLGQHTFSAGYSYDHTRFFYDASRSGPLSDSRQERGRAEPDLGSSRIFRLEQPAHSPTPASL